MKRTPIPALPEWMPDSVRHFAEGAALYDSSCSPEARVFFIDKGEGFYLKSAPQRTLRAEAQMCDYFHKKGLGVELLSYQTAADHDLMLTTRAAGEDCTHALYLENPKRLADTIAEQLRMLHECDFSDCPVQDRMRSYFALAEENYRTDNYDKSHFPDSFGYRCALDAYAVMASGKGALTDRVLLHGDYCLPNIMLENWRFRAFIDLGNGGVGDRHIDLFWGAWTLGFNLGTDAYRERFFDAYGRDRVDEEKLRIVAAAEVFG